MKVLHVLNSNSFSGAEKVVCQIIRSFEGDDGMEMAYCSPEGELLTRMLAQQGVAYLPIPSLTPGHLKRVIWQWKPDLIHAHDMRAGFVTALCCGNIPLVSHIHNNAFNARGLSPKSLAYLLAGRKARHIFWVSRSAFEGYRFHRLFEKKSSLLYNIIDTRLIGEKVGQDEENYDFDLIYVGRLTYPKDPMRLMRVCARVKEAKPDLKAAVVGSGDLEKPARELCGQLGLEDNVRFLGFRENPVKMVSQSKTLVLISHWEGTPMCVLEAMALGTPPVCTASDGMKDLIQSGKNGYLCDTDEELVEAVTKLILDPAHRAVLSENALARFREFNDDAGYKQTLKACYSREVHE